MADTQNDSKPKSLTMPPRFTMSPNLGNIIHLIATMYPYFIIFFLFIVSIFNWNIMKGIMYLLGILFCYSFTVILAKLVPRRRPLGSSLSCEMFYFPGVNYLYPNYSTVITFYTLIYLILPMIESGQINPGIITILTFLSILTGYNQVTKCCTTYGGIFLSIILGSAIAILLYSILKATDHGHLLFYNELLSNNVVCSRPKEQQFKCEVYRNGEIISSNIV